MLRSAIERAGIDAGAVYVTNAVRPQAVVAMGTTGARSILERTVRIGDRRGKPLTDADGRRIFVTIHPASILRQPDSAARRAAFARLVADLHAAGEAVRSNEASS